MLSASQIKGDGSYYQDLAQTDYYTQGGEPPGQWCGEGAERLGLTGQEITKTSLKNLLTGFAPDGSGKLVDNAGKANRQKGFDFTFSAPKDVSIAWAAAPPWIQAEIQRCQQKAVEQTISYLEQHALYTRRGRGGKSVEAAKAVVATYEHSTSRAEEPQIHTHCIFANVCVREDGSTGTFYGRVKKDRNGNWFGVNPLLDHVKSAGAVYRMALATELVRQLGFETVRSKDGFSFEINGVNKEAGHHYSTRRRQIEKAMKEKGFESVEAAEIANFATRAEKRNVNRPKLIAKWKQELSLYGMTPERVEAMCNQVNQLVVTQNTFQDAIRSAEKDLTSDRGFFSRADLIEKASNLLVASGATFEQLNQAVEKEISSGQLVSLGVERLQTQLTTQSVLRMEDKFSRQMKTAGQVQGFQVAKENVDAAIEATESKHGFKYDTNYRRAIEHLVTGRTEDGKNSGANRVILGDAGSGKTTLLGTVKQAFELQGYRVVGAAMAGKAADVLEEKAGIQSATIAKWDYELNRSLYNKIKHEARMYARTVQGNSTWSLDNYKLDDKTVLVIDEAAMTDTPQLYDLYDRARDAGSLVIWSGDDKQCQAIGHGGAFSLAARMTDAARISENFRQERKSDQKIADLIAAGKSDKAIRELVDQDDLRVAATKEKAIDQLVSDWAKEGARDPGQNQIFVGTHKDRHKINEMCQQHRISAHKRRLRTGIKNHEDVRLYQGDRIMIGENLVLNEQHQSFAGYVVDQLKKITSNNLGGEQRVRRGQFATILSINPLNGLLRVKMDDGRLLNVPTSVRDDSKRNILGDYHTNIFGKHIQRKVSISLGYASTVHAAQGSEFKNTFTLLGGRMQDRELSYVQMTRHRKVAKAYTTQTEAGHELTLRSLLNKAEAEQNHQRAEALRKQIAEAAKTQGEQIKDSILARSIAKSSHKEFALSQVNSVQQQSGIER